MSTMLDLKKMADVCDTGHPDQTQLTASIVADQAATSELFKTTQARAALAGQPPSAKQEITMAKKPTTPATKTEAMVDAIDKAYSHVSKLEALLQNAYGESGPTFRNLNDDLQDAYLWACADLAASLKAALEASFTERATS